MEEEKVKGEDTSIGADIEVLKKTFDEAVEKLSIAVGLIKVFSSYDLPTTKIGGVEYTALNAYNTLKASIVINAIDAELFTADQLNSAKELIEKLNPIIDQAVSSTDTNEQAAAPAAVAGKMEAKLEIKNSKNN